MCDLEFGNDKAKEQREGSLWRASWYEQFMQPCLVELLGSALFIFIGCLSVIENGMDTGLLQPALAHGLSLGLIIATLGNISGGHFNPAVSLAAMLIGGLNLMMLLPYWISQLCGGLIGAALAKVVSPEERFWNASGAAFVTVQESGQVAGAVVAEIILTALLILSVCMGAINERTQSPLAPFSIGFSVTVDILAGGAVSGACMNPARAFGPAVMANHWDFHWIYWLGPFLAALLVGVLIRASEAEPVEFLLPQVPSADPSWTADRSTSAFSAKAEAQRSNWLASSDFGLTSQTAAKLLMLKFLRAHQKP
ncbi:aquaporin-8 [Choloepus didactylus]|uniref:aquaporin-8 n=1 Tax=Choloepus didactylus TaxID=27675 RepID=UPI00189FA7D3|nr:aquaporin-8 [Choloepus didactylus]